MRSIRLSLLVLFLVLLALALGGVGLFAYHSMAQTLQDKKKTTEPLLEAQYRERCRESEKKFDEDLLNQARILVSTRYHVDRERQRYRSLHLLGLLGIDATGAGHCLAPLWIAEGAPRYEGLRYFNPIQAELARIPDYAWNSLPDIDEDEIRENLDLNIAQFFQIDGTRGTVYRSDELRKRALSLPWDKELKRLESRPVDWCYFDTELDGKQAIRAVILKTPEPHWQPFLPSRGPRPLDRNSSAAVSGARLFGLLSVPLGQEPLLAVATLPPPRLPSSDLPLRPPIYITCAGDLGDLRAALQEHRDRYEADKAEFEAKTQASLAELRNRLLLLGTFALAAVVFGSIWVIRSGLAPLDRLSEAVSRISPRDFQLPFDERRLPVELSPIVERLKQTLGQLRRTFEREKQATADISHELRTPLAALLTTTEIALRKPRSAEEYREMLEDCRLSGQQMNKAVERLLTLARLDAGVDVLRTRAVDAAVLAEQCAAVVRPLAEARNLVLKVRCDSAAELTTDPDKLSEVVTNLLHNAIQYNRPDGVVELSVHRDGDRVRVEVRDSGIGISPEARERIFERFFRADPSRGEDGLHAGLGLAIVKEYVDLLGGEIAVESAVGQGSTFRVILPAVKRVAA